ncbi:MAG: hypothetical protein J6R42_03160 [Clostridia bacterium]|nr:hypothetical protein [Clostridia bacterium]
MTKKKTTAPTCETCEFYDWDEDYGCQVCTMHLDEDEMLDFLGQQTSHCPYYRYYDEYKTVQKQN